MEEEKIKTVKTWPEPQSVRDIQVFLDFAKFYRRFIKNFSRIATPLTSKLQITENDDLNIQTDQHKKNHDIADNAGGADSADGVRVDGSIKNLSTTAKSADSKI